jgi:hypothetical protein
MMGEAVYLLCGATSLVCVVMLMKAYARTRVRFLMWNAVCFAGFFVNNVILFLDRVVFPDMYLSVARIIPSLVGVCVLIFGLVWEET